ncbi:histidine kinase [Colwellia sp. D2M02]|uniref:sensor histidine kinase n=1 Tax=Colwellia sp. D2M02 TaxID=2841562 RepID=UPI001C07F036|nr:histidine kinase [Colwellia sp. D2M02]MBU2892764.1 histidine kinase [Colwellia sp. D2M02]
MNKGKHYQADKMSESIKNNLAYYLCQLIGFAIIMVFTAIGVLSMPGHADEVMPLPIAKEIIRSFLSYSVTVLLSHYLLRSYHKHSPSTTFLAYFKVILQCAVIATTVDKCLSLLLQTHTPDFFIYQHGLLVELASLVLFNIIFFMLWSLIYLTITSIRDRRKLAEQLKNQQLASLMNQINPHFLFNSLNTIRGMIFEDEDKAAELVTQLSTLFRYNLSTDTKAHTSLGKELAVCQHYLAIEDIRLGERLRIELNNSDESLLAKIPTMGLLTLVENAIKHGIANLKDGGTLTLNSQVKAEQLIIDVINPYQSDLIKSGTKVGLKNLTQRIGLIFSGQGSLKQTTDNNIFHVTMTLPYEPVKNG